MSGNPAQEALVRSVTEKVQNWLREDIGGFQVDGSGSMSFRVGSTRVFVDVMPWSEEKTVIRITASLLAEIPRTPELIEWVALEGANYIFGSVRIGSDPDDADLMNAVFAHNLLGDYIDKEEFSDALRAVAITADGLDTELESKFGGTKFHEDDDE